jgi:hypothetical protein
VASTSGSAERLQKTAGAWRLEFQQLVYNSPVSLRPKRFAVMGEQAILQQLRELSGAELLVRDTERLFRGAPADGAYIARDGRWFPELLPENVPEPEQEASEGAEPELSEHSERGRMLLEELARRMIALEKSLEQLGTKIEGSISALSSAAASGNFVAARAPTEQVMAAVEARAPTVAAVAQSGSAAGPAGGM